MERNVYNTVKHNFDTQMIKERKELVEKVPLLQMLSDNHKNILADALEMVKKCPYLDPAAGTDSTKCLRVTISAFLTGFLDAVVAWCLTHVFGFVFPG